MSTSSQHIVALLAASAVLTLAGCLPDALIGTGYALVDGGVGGCIFAWLCNRFAAVFS
jgi:hypothetical protein